jgi:FkbM family methyltransferase
MLSLFFVNVTIFVLILLMMIQSAMSHTHEHFMKRLLKCGFNPTHIIDIGANRGEWTRDAIRIFPNAKFFMVEGNKMHSPILDVIPNAKYQISLVSDAEKKIVFYQVDRPGSTGSSVFRENTDAPMVKVELDATTIDIIMKKNAFLNATFLKLDIQGSELSALKGATTTLQNIEVLLTEVSLMYYNQGAPSFSDMNNYLNSIGFYLYTLADQLNQGPHHTLIQLDVVYVRHTSTLWDKTCTTYPRPDPWFTPH